MIARAGIATDYLGLDCVPGELPAPAGWLSPAEQAELACWRHPARKAQWMAGRRVAKRLVAEVLGMPVARLGEIEILSRDGAGRPVAPRVRVAGRMLPWSMSIAHTERGAMAAVCYDPDATVGVDLVVLGRDWSGLARMWFTPTEQHCLGAVGDDGTATLWAVKEAFYKAVNAGEPFAPRRFEVHPAAARQYACTYHGAAPAGERCEGAVHTGTIDGQISAVAVLPAARSTRRLSGDS
ncbi:MAG: 4'-phosphopantetheinyl transferase superfamily protein [Thermoguttaceae bacterium]|jgi:phosphopantetheinyl transferase|nr:4'-phosphopantetheinyl transferase superfamily protein [Thermoguttaceae bacterium]